MLNMRQQIEQEYDVFTHVQALTETCVAVENACPSNHLVPKRTKELPSYQVVSNCKRGQCCRLLLYNTYRS